MKQNNCYIYNSTYYKFYQLFKRSRNIKCGVRNRGWFESRHTKEENTYGKKTLDESGAEYRFSGSVGCLYRISRYGRRKHTGGNYDKFG